MSRRYRFYSSIPLVPFVIYLARCRLIFHQLVYFIFSICTTLIIFHTNLYHLTVFLQYFPTFIMRYNHFNVYCLQKDVQKN